MKNKKKSIILIILSIIFLVASFFKSWYSDQLFNSLFLFALIPNIILMILFNVLMILSITLIVKDRLYINFISIIILLISIILFVCFPFRELKVKYEVNAYENQRLEIIELIKNEELKPDEYGNVSLPKKYKMYSVSGEVYLYQNDEDGQVIGFWVFRGMLSGSIEVIYSTGGEELIRANESGHPITKIEKLKDKWYLVETDY